MTSVNKNNFNIACCETIEIINHMEDNLRRKIPSKIIDFLKRNQLKEYNVNIDFSKNILEQNILSETQGIISIIYRDYIATPEKRTKLLEWDKQEKLRAEIEKREKYNPDNIFQSYNKKNNISQNVITNKVGIREYKKQIFKKIINIIKKFFYKR